MKQRHNQRPLRAGVVRLACLTIICLVAAAPAGNCLTMEEAVEYALENNHKIKEYAHLEAAARAVVRQEKSSFLPGAGLFYAYNQSDVDDAFSWKDDSYAGVEATYNIFNGFSDVAAVKSAEASAGAALHLKTAQTSDIILETKLAFIDVLRKRRAIKTAEEGVTLLERQVRDASLYFREGLFAENDVLKVKVELSSVKQELITAQGDFNVAVRRLESLMGRDVTDSDAVADFEGLPEAGDLDFASLQADMFAARSELKYLEAEKEAYRQSAASVKGGYLPSVDLSVSYTRYGDEAWLNGNDDLYDSETAASLTATWTFFDGFYKRRRIAELKSRMRSLDENILDTRQSLLLQLKEALEGYRVAAGRLNAAETAVSQARENYRVTQNQFRQQIATTTDLLDARFYQTRADTQYNNALYDMHAWIARIERIVEDYER